MNIGHCEVCGAKVPEVWWSRVLRKMGRGTVSYRCSCGERFWEPGGTPTPLGGCTLAHAHRSLEEEVAGLTSVVFKDCVILSDGRNSPVAADWWRDRRQKAGGAG